MNILDFFNFSNCIKISFFISFISQICFIHILSSINYSYKYFGFIIHLFIIFLIFFCLSGFLKNEIKIFKKIQFLNKIMKIITFFLILFYLILLLKLKYSEMDSNMYILLIFSITIYSIFHFLMLNNLSNFIEKYKDKMIENSTERNDDAVKEELINNDFY